MGWSLSGHQTVSSPLVSRTCTMISRDGGTPKPIRSGLGEWFCAHWLSVAAGVVTLEDMRHLESLHDQRLSTFRPMAIFFPAHLSSDGKMLFQSSFMLTTVQPFASASSSALSRRPSPAFRSYAHSRAASV